VRFVIGDAPIHLVIGGESMFFVIREAPVHFDVGGVLMCFVIGGTLGHFVIREHRDAFDFL